MKSTSSALITAFLILLTGIITIIVIISVNHFSVKSYNELNQVNAFNRLNALIEQVQLHANTLKIDHSESTLMKVEASSAELKGGLLQLVGCNDFVEEESKKVDGIISQVAKVRGSFEAYKQELSKTPDSLQQQVADEFFLQVAGNSFTICERVSLFKNDFNVYINSLQIAADSDEAISKKLEWSLLGIVVILFSVIAILAYKKIKKFEDYKYSTEEQIIKETSRLQTMNRFVEAIASGRYQEQIAYDQDDVMAKSLVDMQQQLYVSTLKEKNRNWAVQGIAEIGAIIRDFDSAEVLYSNIITFVVKYTKSNQGGLFVLHGEGSANPRLQLVSAYAYDRKKYLDKEIGIGEGLIGQAFLEAETIYMTQVPSDYVYITSGLGDAPPSSVIIVPLKLNDKVYGVMELASFHRYEDFEREFLEKLAETVASSISNADVNERTRILLEQSQEQSEQLRAQEEELRQNMEEMTSTNEQMERQMQEIKLLSKSSHDREEVYALTTILSESDLLGTITLVNKKLIEVSQYSEQELIGKPHNIFRHPDMPKELFKLFWDTLKKGEIFRGIVKNRAKDGSHYWVDATIVPIRDEYGKVYKYSSARYHIKNDTLAEELYNKQAEKLGLPKLGIS